MIVLDTNVVSEFMRDHPRPEVLAWLDQQLANTLFVTAVTEAEVRSGIALLPSGRRRRGLAAAACLRCPVRRTYLALRQCGRPRICRDRGGSPCRWPAEGARVATRDVDDFAGCGIEVMNPWSAGRQV